MSFSVEDRLTPEGKKYLEQIEKLCKLELIVGFQSGKASEDDGTDICDIAAFNEFGTENNIPSRPFIRNSFDDNKAAINNFMTTAAKAISNGTPVQRVLNSAGVHIKSLVQAEITDGNFKPNAESTIKRKGSSTPLIDTGRMRQSVQFVVRAKTKGD